VFSTITGSGGFRKDPGMTESGRTGPQPDPPGEPAERSLVPDAARPHTGAASNAAKLSGAQHVATLKLAEVVMAILYCRQRLPLAASAALVREPHGEGTFIRMVFLDDRQEPLPVDQAMLAATAYLAGKLDDDLAMAFGDRNVIILK
jgi:hypothetical protein